MPLQLPLVQADRLSRSLLPLAQSNWPSAATLAKAMRGPARNTLNRQSGSSDSTA